MVVQIPAPGTVSVDRRQLEMITRAARGAVDEVKMAYRDGLPVGASPAEIFDTERAVLEAERILTGRDRS